MVQYTAAQLKLAHTLQRTIESFQNKIDSLTNKITNILGGGIPIPLLGKRGRRKMSAAARAKIGAAQKLRWAKTRGSSAGKTARKGKRTMSASARAKIAAAARARWAKAKAAGKSRL